MKAAQPEDLRLVRRDVQPDLAASFRSHLREAFGIVLDTKGHHDIIGIPAPHGLASPVLLHPGLDPEVERIV